MKSVPSPALSSSCVGPSRCRVSRRGPFRRRRAGRRPPERAGTSGGAPDRASASRRCWLRIEISDIALVRPRIAIDLRPMDIRIGRSCSTRSRARPNRMPTAATRRSRSPRSASMAEPLSRAMPSTTSPKPSPMPKFRWHGPRSPRASPRQDISCGATARLKEASASAIFSRR